MGPSIWKPADLPERLVFYCQTTRASTAARCWRWYFITEEPAPAPHLAQPEARTALTYEYVLQICNGPDFKQIPRMTPWSKCVGPVVGNTLAAHQISKG